MVQDSLISIITLNYNQTAVTLDFLESTRCLTYPNYEIIVCDMGSEGDPTEEINSRNIPNTKVFRSESNLGFAAGNNWGATRASGEFLLLINNDTVVSEHLLQELILPFASNQTIAVVCPKIKMYHQPDTIEYAGFRKMNFLTGRTSAIGSGEKDNGQYDKDHFTASAHGCAMLVKTEVYKEMRGFNERYFLYYEDWDLSHRIIQAGYKILYRGCISVYHKGSVTTGKNTAFQTYYLTRNRILFVRLHTNGFQFILFSCFFIFFSAPKAIISYITAGKFVHLKAFFKAIIRNINS